MSFIALLILRNWFLNLPSASAELYVKWFVSFIVLLILRDWFLNLPSALADGKRGKEELIAFYLRQK